MSLPTARDINPNEVLDGKCAQDHFLGKSVDDAVLLVSEDFEIYQEDLMFMGPSAFCYYLPAAIQYAESNEARYDACVAGTMLMVLRQRWAHDRDEIMCVRDTILRHCHGVLDRIPKMDIDRNLDGNLEGKFRRFVRKLEAV